jgi:hypothetical protein
MELTFARTCPGRNVSLSRFPILTGCVLLLSLGVGLPTAAGAQDSVSTNFELVRDAARLACEDLVGKLSASNVRGAVSLRSVGTHEGDFLMENALSSVLAAKGFDVRTRPDSTGPLLEFEVVDLGLAYTRTWRHAWLGERRVEREARARVFARLVDQDEAHILWAEQAEAKVVDEVPESSLGDLEEKGDVEYLQATLPPRRWNKYVEPVVVTAIVVGLIVLFFANQDSSN